MLVCILPFRLVPQTNSEFRLLINFLYISLSCVNALLKDTLPCGMQGSGMELTTPVSLQLLTIMHGKSPASPLCV